MGLGAVDDLGLFGAPSSSEHSTGLCFVSFIAVGSSGLFCPVHWESLCMLE